MSCYLFAGTSRRGRLTGSSRRGVERLAAESSADILDQGTDQLFVGVRVFITFDFELYTCQASQHHFRNKKVNAQALWNTKYIAIGAWYAHRARSLALIISKGSCIAHPATGYVSPSRSLCFTVVCVALLPTLLYKNCQWHLEAPLRF